MDDLLGYARVSTGHQHLVGQPLRLEPGRPQPVVEDVRCRPAMGWAGRRSTICREMALADVGRAA